MNSKEQGLDLPISSSSVQTIQITPRPETPKKVLRAEDIAFKFLSKETSPKPQIQPDSSHNLNVIEEVPSFKIYTLDQFPAPSEPLDKRFVHKIFENNVVIKNPIRIDSSKHIYRSKILVPLSNTFFFDHMYEHIPGMMLIEAFRQFGTAISHIYFNIPFDYSFILYNMNTEFKTYTKIQSDAFVDFVITDIKYKHSIARKFVGVGFVHQDNLLTSKFESSWAVLPNSLLNKLEQK